MIKHPYNPLPISRIRSDAKRRNRRNSLRRCRRHFPGLLLENNREGANESTGPFQQETTVQSPLLQTPYRKPN